MVLVFGNSMQSVAAGSCICVRDYGYHKYDHRIYYSTSELYVLGFSGNRLRAIETTTTYGECVCGEPGTVVKQEEVFLDMN